jgi:phospholipid/cholesterol/gamma-HCH transport system substrate-binding protein
VYVELDRKAPGEEGVVPKSFVASHPVIPSAPSGIKQISAGVNDILQSVRQIDFKGISDQVVKTAKTIDNFVSGEQMRHIMVNLSTASERLASAGDKINRLMDDTSIREAAQGAKEVIQEARAVIAQVKGEVESLQMAQTMGRINQFVAGTSSKVQSTLTDVQETAERLRRASDSLDMLMDRLNADPSALIFSRQPKGD